ncbi:MULTISPECIES: F0F1 ATP synthase subunit epsilon [Bartonella]|uniref:ATP synthase epsilon chain n=1 Tax=Bartonella choladocola TaxID=2750995 RepID=A0A1U9ML01_9HYPH|nr:F0F1 ATP synthase subunit epsilon [Bartonella choladocola]AQT48382.1 ATP synthase F1 subcomplex epsilon subunit [Bartonella choladocola]MBI0139369.1 F0F1 ATP synthase subunit epsilon [Bartonella choladocola]
MAKTFLFELVSPEQLLLSEQATEVVLPGSEGYMTILPDHSPVMTAVTPGIITVKSATGQMSFVVYGGFADINRNGCSLLAESAVSLEKFDINDLQRRINEARDVFQEAETDEARNRAEDFLHQLTSVENVISTT